MRNKLLCCPSLPAFLLGALAVAALPPFYFFPFLFVSFSGLLWLIGRSPSPGSAFRVGYAFGFAFFAFGLSWIGNALLIEADTFGWLYPVVLLASGAFFGLFAAFPAWFSFYFRQPLARWLAFASLWVIFEWIRSFFLTGFPWNLIGTVLAFNSALLQFASVGGTYALSLLVILACSTPALLSGSLTRRRLLAVIACSLGIPAGLWIFGTLRLSNENPARSDITVRLVQPGIPQTMKWNNSTLENNLSEYIKYSSLPGLENIDFVIWGETASPFPLDLDLEHNLKIRAAVPPQGYLITGQIRYGADETRRYVPRNSMLVLNPQGQTAAYYDKSHLVPFGEYIPLRSWLPQWIRPLANAIGTFASGHGPQLINLPGYPPLGALICYEVIFPGEIVNPAKRPQWIINLTNDGWYGDSAGPRQHFVSTRLRAIEEGITIVRAANTGISAVISPYGTLLGQLSLNQAAILDEKLPKTLQVVTTYGKIGNLFTLTWCFFNLLLAFFLSARKL